MSAAGVAVFLDRPNDNADLQHMRNALIRLGNGANAIPYPTCIGVSVRCRRKILRVVRSR